MKDSRIVTLANNLLTYSVNIQKGDNIVVEGRLQTNTVKTEDGSEKKIVELNASSFEKLSGSSMTASTSNVSEPTPDGEQIVKFGADEFSESLIGEDEIPF